MTTSDAGNADIRMSELASSFLELRDIVLEQWSARVTAEIPSATRLGEPILINTLPSLYDNIAHSLVAGAPRPFATAGTNLAIAHGRERANMTDYGPHELIHELQIFREVLFGVATARRLPLSKHDAEVIGHSIEEAARESISGYNAFNREVNETFIATLSHDLRNPLHVANASAQLIQLKTSDPGVTELAKRICAKIAETDAMIQTLLDAAVLKGKTKLKLDVAGLDIMQVVEEVCSDIPLSGQHVIIDGERIEGYWCRVSLKRVLENLISNARKYGDSSRPITVRVVRGEAQVLLAVHNEGRPIPEQELEKLFQAFHRIEDVNVTGWGLGLPYVRHVAESHGGTVVVDSAEQRGTTFTVSLPIDARPYVGH
jgi:signal transduction histidine kinase